MAAAMAAAAMAAVAMAQVGRVAAARVVGRCEVESVICVSDRPKSGSVGRVGPVSIHSRFWVGRSGNFDQKPPEFV